MAFASAVSDAPLSGPGALVSVGDIHRYPAASPGALALRTARPRLIEGGGPEDLVQSTLVVPMVAHDTVVGLAQFSRTKGSEPFGERDRAVAVELAARAAVCIDNARLYRREHERALILQRSLLPPGDPEAAGLDIACRYLPGNAATEVGGDWFDVIELPGHRTALVVGDVMGRGLRAAVAMGELRTAVRTLALLDLEPAEVLTALDEIARGLGAPGGSQQASRAALHSRDADRSEVYLATCVYAVYDPVTRRCTIANAGHMPPVLVEPPDEAGVPRPALLLEVPPGMPLGVGGEPFEEVEVDLPEGALLALYTDGLVESRDHPLEEGLRGLREALADPVRPLEDVCDHVLNTLDTRHGEDDIALLMARVQGLPVDAVGDWQLPREARSVGRARELARASSRPGAWRACSTRPNCWSVNWSPTHCGTARARSGCGCCWTARWFARSGTRTWSSPAAGGPGTRTRAAAASSWSACSRRAGAPAQPTAARPCGSNCRCPARRPRPSPNCRRSSC